jgi:hypothetical protein
MYITRTATLFLNQALNLPATGREQDWEIEMADKERVGDFVEYIENNELDSEKKFALMALILCSLDDLLCDGEIPHSLWKNVRKILKDDQELFADLVDRWTSQHNGSDDFRISPLLRSL